MVFSREIVIWCFFLQLIDKNCFFLQLISKNSKIKNSINWWKCVFENSLLVMYSGRKVNSVLQNGFVKFSKDSTEDPRDWAKSIKVIVIQIYPPENPALTSMSPNPRKITFIACSPLCCNQIPRRSRRGRSLQGGGGGVPHYVIIRYTATTIQLL